LSKRKNGNRFEKAQVLELMPNEISAGLTILKDESGKPALCLVTGATGYIGGRLIAQLLDAGYRVRVLARNPQRLRNHPWINQVEVIEGDANDTASLDKALNGVAVAYYLLHALLVKGDFEQLERKMAKDFGTAAKHNGVGKIIYLGGIITPGQEASLTCRPESTPDAFLPNLACRPSSFAPVW
jgi:nucleoside-diphosphate-sugar epimerase